MPAELLIGQHITDLGQTPYRRRKHPGTGNPLVGGWLHSLILARSQMDTTILAFETVFGYLACMCIHWFHRSGMILGQSLCRCNRLFRNGKVERAALTFTFALNPDVSAL